jgi:hypothetical protein
MPAGYLLLAPHSSAVALVARFEFLRQHVPAPASNYKQLVTLLGVRQAHGLRKAQKLGVEVPLSGRPEVGPRMGWSAEWRPLRRIDDRQRPLCTNRLQQRIAAMPPLPALRGQPLQAVDDRLQTTNELLALFARQRLQDALVNFFGQRI